MNINPTHLFGFRPHTTSKSARNFLFVFLFLLCSQYIHAQSYRWAAKATSSSEDATGGIALDNKGNYYVIGRFSGTINFDSSGFTRSLTSAGLVDIYIAKFDCNRNRLWANRIGGTSAECGAFGYTDIKYDNNGNLYVTGSFAGSATFTTQTGSSQILSSSGSNDIFIAKYDTSGVLSWSVKAGSVGTDEATSLLIDHSGNIVAAGFFTGTATWGATSGPTVSATSGGVSDVFVVKYTPAGQPIWVTKASSPGEDLANELAVDQQNNIYVAGNFACCGGGTATFGSKTINNLSGWGAFFAKMDSNGLWSWVNGMGGTGAEAGAACIVDDSGNVFVSGHYDAATTLTSQSPGLPIALANAGNFDIFLAKYDTAGVLIWATSVGGTGFDANYSLCFNERKNIVITGAFSNTVYFSVVPLTSSGNTDVYVSEYTKNGYFVQCLKGGGSGSDAALTIISDSKGALYLGGYYTSTATFGPHTLTGLGNLDAFIAKISLGPSFTLLPVSPICPGNSATLRSSSSLPLNSIYKWLKNGVIIPSENKDSLIVNSAGSYQLIASNLCNESDTSQILIVTSALIIPSPISDKTICMGDSVQLVSSGGTSYVWSPATGLSNPNVSNPFAKPPTNQQYIVTINFGSCSVNDTVMVNVNTNCCFSCATVSPVNAGLVACFPFNGNANDGTNYGNNGTAQANATLTTDRKNQASKAYTFNGSPTARINVPASTSLNTVTMSGFTYAFWFNASASTPFLRRLVCIQDVSLKNYELSYSSVTNKINFLNFNGVADNISIDTKTTFTLGTWYHVALTIDAANKPRVYVNGILDTFSTTSVLVPSNPTYTIGNHAVNPWNFVGKIDDIRVYNRELSGAELLQLHTQLDAPIVSPMADKTICIGDSTQLSANGGTIYSWSPATGLSNPNIANPYVKITSDQQYIVTISNGVCSTKDTVMVFVNTNCCANCTSTIPLNNGLVACYPFNGNAADVTGNNYHGTMQGATLIADRFGVPARAYNFNGTNNYMTVSPNYPDLTRFSISLWIKPSGNTSGDGTIFWEGNSICGNDIAMVYKNNTLSLIANKSGAVLNTYSLNTSEQALLSPSLFGQWYHIVWSMDSSQSNIYINGSLQKTVNLTGSGIGFHNTPTFGAFNDGNGAPCGSPLQKFFQGGLDDIRIYNRALSAAEAGQLYTNLFTPIVTPLTDKTICSGDSAQLSATGGTLYSWSPTTGLSNPNIANPFAKPATNQQYIVTISNGSCSTSDTVLVNVNTNCCATCSTPDAINTGLIACYPFDNNTNDASGNAHHGSPTNITYGSDRFGNPLKCGSFNGTSSEIAVPVTDFQLNTYSYSVWVNVANYPASANMYSILSIGSDLADQFVMLINNSALGFGYGSYFANLTTPDRYWVGAFPSLNTWHHIVLTRTTTTLKFYIDGVLLDTRSTSSSNAAYGSSGIQFTIGARSGSTPHIQYFKGLMDDMRIYNRALSTQEVSQLYTLANIPVITHMSDKNVCLGDSIQLTPNGGTSYLWNTSTSLSRLNIANPYAKPIDTTQYFVTVTKGLCSATDSVKVNVNKVVLDAGLNQTICFRDSIRLAATGSAGATYTWTPAISLNNPTIDSPYAKPSDTTLYRVTATLNGCTAKDSVTINVKKVLADAGNSQSICIGDSIQFNASGGTSYAWNQHSTLSDTAIQNPYAKPGITTQYFVTVKDGACSNIDSITISIGTTLNVSAGIDTSICLGDSVRLLATGATSYRWSTAFTLSDSTIANPYAKPSDTTIYYVTGKSASCIDIDTVIVNVKKPTLDAGLTQTICNGDSIRLNVIGTLGSIFSWVSDSSLSSLSIANPYAKPADTITYYVTALSNGCMLNDSVTVNVRTVPAEAGAGGSICLGDSIQLNASGGVIYTWQNNPTLSSLSGPNPYAKPVTNTMYYVTVNDGTCSNTDSVEITLNNTINLNAGLDTAVCSGDSVQLTVTGTALSFTWTPAAGLSNTAIANPKASPLNTTDYIIRGQSGVCYDLDTIRVTVNQAPTVDLGPDTAKCEDQSFEFAPMITNANTYSWQPSSDVSDPTIVNPFTNLTTSQTFILTVTNSANGCKSSDTITVNVQKPVAQFSLDETKSSTPPFIVKPHNTSYPTPLSYEWEMMDSVSAFYTSMEPTHTFTKPGIYRILLTVIDDKGCIDTVSQMIELTQDAPLFIPNVFTPNGDGLNDVFRVGFTPGTILEMRGSIWNRWGAKIYEFGSPDYIWWNGTADGQDASDGVYFYIIEVLNLQNEVLKFHGTVTLLR